VCLVLATQRAIISALGGGAVRANMSEVLVGKVARASESRHATGAEKEIPDIREYAKGAPGYFQRWDPHSGTVAGRGRAFLLGKPPDELAYMKRIVAAREHLRDWSIPDMPPLADGDGQAEAAPAGVTDETAQQITGMRAKLAAIAQTATQAVPQPRPVPATTVPLPIPLEIPQADGQTLLRLLAQPDGVSAKEAGEALGKSRSRAGDYLRAMANREPPIAVRTGSSRSSRYRLVRPGEAQPEPAAARPDGYVTLDSAIKTLTEAVRNGLDVDDDTRAVLEQAQQIGQQTPVRRHLTVVPDVRDPERSDAL
jgi:hypothetical protein